MDDYAALGHAAYTTADHVSNDSIAIPTRDGYLYEPTAVTATIATPTVTITRNATCILWSYDGLNP